MTLTASVIVGAITFIVAELMKPINKFNNKYIPYVNFTVGVVSALIVIFCHIGDGTVLENIFYCILSAMGAGGVYEFVHVSKK